jgi:transposase
MLVKTILNHCYKFKSFVYKNVHLLTDDKGNPIIIVDIEARTNGHKLCSMCRHPGPGYDRLKPRRYKFVPLWGIPVFLRYARRRVTCPIHGVIVEYIPWAEGKSHLTNVFKLFLSYWAGHLSWSTVAGIYKVQWYHVFESVEWVVKYGLENRCLDKIKAIGIDEIQYRTGHVYLTLVYQIDSCCRRLLYVGKDRKSKSLLRFFYQFGTVRTSSLEVICSDMWKPYLKVITKKVPQALNILDRFHIMKKFNEAVDKTRRKEVQELEGSGLGPILKNSRWCLLKNKNNQKESQLAKLKELLKHNLKSVKCMLLREAFQQFWTYRSSYWAKRFFDQWQDRVNRSNLDEMKQVAKMLRRHEELIFNWFKTKEHFSNGIVEGFNNKAKLTIRKAYGFKHFKTVEVALYHQLGNLPVPKLTHTFY